MPALKRSREPSRMKVVHAEFSMGRSPRKVSEFEMPIDGAEKQGMKAHNPEKDLSGRLKGIMLILIILILLVAGLIFFLVYNALKETLGSLPNDSQGAAVSSSQTLSEDHTVKEENKNLLVLVGMATELSEDYEFTLMEYRRISGEEAAVTALEEMILAAKGEGVSLDVTKGYVSVSEQQALFEEQVQTLLEEGYTGVRAEALAKDTAAPGGRDEHQTGLAFDFWQEDLEASADFAVSDAYNWLTKNCVKYGFVLRYPSRKEKETGMSFDPVHFRYVGEENAAKMRTLDMCLEEYAAYVKKQEGR